MDGVIRFVSGYVWTRKLLNPKKEKSTDSKLSGYVWTRPQRETLQRKNITMMTYVGIAALIGARIFARK